MLEKMIFLFPPHIQAGINSGTYEVVKNSAGVALGMARDSTTKRFVGHAVGTAAQPFLALPHLALGPLNLLGEGVLSFQVHRGFQKTYQILENLQHSVGLLQATTSLIGVTSVATLAVSGVNLYQTMKLKQEVKELKVKIEDGFSQTLEKIVNIPDEIEFREHRRILIMAYGKFLEATKMMKLALNMEDINARNITLGNVQKHLSDALNAYNQTQLFENTCAAGQLRRFECVWMIEQAQAFNYQLLNAPEAAHTCLIELQNRIKNDSLKVINACESQEELDFIYPEIAHIQNQDLPILSTWQNRIDYTKQLAPDEREEIKNLVIQQGDNFESEGLQIEVLEPIEIKKYETLKSKSHYESLRDQLKFVVQPDLRQNYENQIEEKAIASSKTGIANSNWAEISDLTIANLYHYFHR